MKPEVLQEEAQKLHEIIVSNRRYLHTHPETGFDLKETVSYVKKELEEIL